MSDEDYIIDDNSGENPLLVPLEMDKKIKDSEEKTDSLDGLSFEDMYSGGGIGLVPLDPDSSANSIADPHGNKAGMSLVRKSQSEYETILLNAIDDGSLEYTYNEEMQWLCKQKNIANLSEEKEILEGNIQELRNAFVSVHNGAVYQIELQKKYEKMLSEAASRGNLPYSYAAELNHINDSLKIYEKEVISTRKSALDKAYKKVKGKRGTIAAVLMLLIAVVAFFTFIFVRMNIPTVNNNDNEKNLLAENLKLKGKLQDMQTRLDKQQKEIEEATRKLEDERNKGDITQEEYEAKVKELQEKNENLFKENKNLAEQIEKNNQAIVAATVAEEEKVNKKNRAEITRKARERKLASEKFKPGNHVTLGSYPYDDSGNKKAIEWIVLERNTKDGYALLTSIYALDAQKYETAGGNAIYAVSSVRRWLNETFKSSAFTKDEQARIRQTLIRTQNSENTQDYVFLLSDDEANKYFARESLRTSRPTEWAKKQGAVTMIKDSGACWWWLRSPGNDGETAFGVASDGSIDEAETNTVAAVRPALWYKFYD